MSFDARSFHVRAHPQYLEAGNFDWCVYFQVLRGAVTCHEFLGRHCDE
jgi:hypothetical protein